MNRLRLRYAIGLVIATMAIALAGQAIAVILVAPHEERPPPPARTVPHRDRQSPLHPGAIPPLPSGRSQAVGYIALFVALCGTAYAVNLPRNSVGTKQLKNSAVATKKIAKDAVTSSRVRDGTLQANDFASGVLLKGGPGRPGPRALQAAPTPRSSGLSSRPATVSKRRSSSAAATRSPSTGSGWAARK